MHASTDVMWLSVALDTYMAVCEAVSRTTLVLLLLQEEEEEKGRGGRHTILALEVVVPQLRTDVLWLTETPSKDI